MKKTLIALALTSASIVSVNNAMASDSSTMRFVGSVEASSCDLDTSDLSSISMPSVTQKDFSAKGATSGAQSFTIKVSDCPNTVKKAQLSVSGTADSTDSSLLAIDTGDNMASGLAIALTAQGNPLAINSGKSIPRTVTNGETTFAMTAKYVATSDTVVSGGVSASAQVNITYM
ncbi:TPA: type 1 fimbrial protein [Klebsiella oxytoca]|nr:type 1 fimbrial protein [Klebsiella oxytoca]